MWTDSTISSAPPPNVSPTQVAESAKASATSSSRFSSVTAPISPNVAGTTTTDPRDNLPSSPPQIYLNLLILESSLRLQYLSLRARLRLHLLLLTLLSAWCAIFTWLLFFRPREDGSGVGGSVYWVVESIEKLGWCGGVVTLGLFWGTGMYERGVRWPRKFVGKTNRGLRTFNLKVVVVKGGFWAEVAGWLGMLDPLGWYRDLRVDFQVLPKDIEAAASAMSNSGGAQPEKLATKDHWNAHAARHGLIEEDIASSGDVLKLLLLPKPFSPDFREGWETYRMEYWERENARRADLRRVVRTRRQEVARRDGGLLWWTGWRGWRNVRIWNGRTRRERDLERLALVERPSGERSRQEREKRRREGLLRGESHSRGSSRSSTPAPDPLEASTRRSRTADQSLHVRRESGSSSGGSTARRPRRRDITQPGSRLSATETLLQDGSETAGAGRPRGLTKKESNLSTSSTGSGGEEATQMEDSPSRFAPKFMDAFRQEPAEA